jgi:hypothetical protein
LPKVSKIVIIWLMNQRFFENMEGLERAGAISSSSVDAGSFRIDNLDSRTAVEIAHELTKRIDALGSTGHLYNDSNYKLLDSIEASNEKRLLEEQTIFESTPANGNYRVEVMLPERRDAEEIGAQLGKYSIVASLVKERDNLRSEEAAAETRQKLQQSFGSLFERVNFFKTEEEQDIEKQLKSLGVPIHQGTKAEHEEFEQQEVAEIERVETLLRSIGVKDINLAELNDLCEVKKWDSISIIDLYILVMTNKVNKGHVHPQISLRDLSQKTNYLIDDYQAQDIVDAQTAIRRKQEKQMIPRLKKIGLDEEEANNRYDFYEGDEKSRLAFRFAAWLVSRKFIQDTEVIKGLKEDISMGGRVPPNPKFFGIVTAAAFETYQRFQRERHDNYNLSIDWEKADYHQGLDYHTNITLLCMYIFYGKDISEFRKVK